MHLGFGGSALTCWAQLLKECADELDMGTQYHLSRFAFLYESTVVADGTMLNPMGAPDEGELYCLDSRLTFARTWFEDDVRDHR